MPHEEPGKDDAPPSHPLDSEESKDLHRRLRSYLHQELDRQGENRFQMAVDEDYYDSIQWSEEDAQVLKERGQAPLVFNVIAQSVNWIIGSEKRGRTDFNVLPRKKQDAKPAEAKTKILKYLSDVNRLPFHRSRAFEDTTKVGIGWVEDSYDDSTDGEPIYSRYESWRNVIFDSASTELDGSDMRYLFRPKWLDVDMAQALIPSRADEIAKAAVDAERYGNYSEQDGDEAMDWAEFNRESYSQSRTVSVYRRRRVRLIECWYRVPRRVTKFLNGDLRGEIFDEANQNHVTARDSGYYSLGERITMQVRVAIFTSRDMLYEGVSPFRHNRFSLTPIWGFRRGRDNLPYGVIRWMRDIQDDINKRASKALYILSSNKVVMDEGAVDDIEEFREEVARPDAVLVKKQGKQIELNVDRELAAPHLELMSRDIQMLQQVGGVTDELLGRSTNAVSGVAIQARQEQGTVATNKLFDNLRFAVQMEGEIQLSLIEQFMSEEKTFRITNERGKADFITINDGLPENDIVRTKADFIIGESDWRATYRQAAAEQLSQMLMKMPPQVALVMLDLWAESTDLPNREEIVKRIRQVNGMRDPDATEPTPEELQQQQAAAEQAQAQQAMFMAELAEKQGKADKAQADAVAAQANADLRAAQAEQVRRQTVGINVDAINTAMTAATAIVTMPTIAKVGDAVLVEAGYENNGVAPAGGLHTPTPQQAVNPAAQGLPPQPQPQPQPPQEPAVSPSPEQLNGAAPSNTGGPVTPDQTIQQ
ncbi:Phage portal protein [Ralstonia phage UAM5]|nr:Phage portal protein [Ralstonia phage UAM5]